jgi:hypothetical protein
MCVSRIEFERVQIRDAHLCPSTNQTKFSCQMRGWVGVQNQKQQKMLYPPSIQDFEGNVTLKPSAHLMGTGFQRFASCGMTIYCVMILLFAQLHLENQIQQRFQTLAIAIHQNPY